MRGNVVFCNQRQNSSTKYIHFLHNRWVEKSCSTKIHKLNNWWFRWIGGKRSLKNNHKFSRNEKQEKQKIEKKVTLAAYILYGWIICVSFRWSAAVAVNLAITKCIGRQWGWCQWCRFAYIPKRTTFQQWMLHRFALMFSNRIISITVFAHTIFKYGLINFLFPFSSCSLEKEFAFSVHCSNQIFLFPLSLRFTLFHLIQPVHAQHASTAYVNRTSVKWKGAIYTQKQTHKEICFFEIKFDLSA